MKQFLKLYYFILTFPVNENAVKHFEAFLKYDFFFFFFLKFTLLILVSTSLAVNILVDLIF